MKKLFLICLPVPCLLFSIHERLAVDFSISADHRSKPEKGNILAGGFFDEKGNYLGYDGKRDGKVYVLKTTRTDFGNECEGNVQVDNIDEREKQQAINYIRRYSGNPFAFIDEPDTGIYKNFQEIMSSKDIRMTMYSIVSTDKEKKLDDSADFREYGGRVDMVRNGKLEVIVAIPGTAQDPSANKLATILIDITHNTVAEFHSHPGGETTSHRFKQAPSALDVHSVNNRVGYVFGMYNNIVYIYNKNGIAATFPLKSFVDPFR